MPLAVLRVEVAPAVELLVAQEMERAVRAAFEQGRPRLAGKLQEDIVIDEVLPIRDEKSRSKHAKYTRYRADGGIFTADAAKKYGLIDQIGYADDVYTWVKTQANLKNPQIIKYQRPISLMGLFGSESRYRGANQLNGADKPLNININLDAQTLDELRSRRVLYLWRGD